MKEIKKNQTTATSTTTVDKQPTATPQVTTPDGKPVVSLNDLKTILPDIRHVKTPTAKELRALQPILEQPLEDGGLWVYSNGFALYKSGKRTSVLRVTRASSHTYEFADGEKTLSLNDQPWATALALYGEGRIEQNTREWGERRHVSYDGFDDSDEDEEAEGIVLKASDDVEGTVVKKLSGDMERMLGCLSPRQRQVIEMYYFQSLNQQEIADKLDIDRTSVTHYLADAHENMKKKFDKTF
ncbi:MAG: sigma factor-like helix-turn-helix DNA-binding protein [Eubacteriales bacterium]|nr:sigma factor-like helix-turn-helix DNA-binding protein [Eubacteriales bacterium]MDD4446022.1 sigma factor-like helix-turn-helix DNA-binding protein [Eubacteriales bacterium]